MTIYQLRARTWKRWRRRSTSGPFSISSSLSLETWTLHIQRLSSVGWGTEEPFSNCIRDRRCLRFDWNRTEKPLHSLVIRATGGDHQAQIKLHRNRRLHVHAFYNSIEESSDPYSAHSINENVRPYTGIAKLIVRGFSRNNEISVHVLHILRFHFLLLFNSEN